MKTPLQRQLIELSAALDRTLSNGSIPVLDDDTLPLIREVVSKDARNRRRVFGRAIVKWIKPIGQQPRKRKQ